MFQLNAGARFASRSMLRSSRSVPSAFRKVRNLLTPSLRTSGNPVKTRAQHLMYRQNSAPATTSRIRKAFGIVYLGQARDEHTSVKKGAECCKDAETKQNRESEEHHRIKSYPCCVHLRSLACVAFLNIWNCGAQAGRGLCTLDIYGREIQGHAIAASRTRCASKTKWYILSSPIDTHPRPNDKICHRP